MYRDNIRNGKLPQAGMAWLEPEAALPTDPIVQARSEDLGRAPLDPAPSPRSVQDQSMGPQPVLDDWPILKDYA